MKKFFKIAAFMLLIIIGIQASAQISAKAKRFRFETIIDDENLMVPRGSGFLHYRFRDNPMDIEEFKLKAIPSLIRKDATKYCFAKKGQFPEAKDNDKYWVIQYGHSLEEFIFLYKKTLFVMEYMHNSAYTEADADRDAADEATNDKAIAIASRLVYREEDVSYYRSQKHRSTSCNQDGTFSCATTVHRDGRKERIAALPGCYDNGYSLFCGNVIFWRSVGSDPSVAPTPVTPTPVTPPPAPPTTPPPAPVASTGGCCCTCPAPASNSLVESSKRLRMAQQKYYEEGPQYYPQPKVAISFNLGFVFSNLISSVQPRNQGFNQRMLPPQNIRRNRVDYVPDPITRRTSVNAGAGGNGEPGGYNGNPTGGTPSDSPWKTF